MGKKFDENQQKAGASTHHPIKNAIELLKPTAF